MIRRLTPVWRLRATGAALILPPLVHVVRLDRIVRWIAGTPRPAGADNDVDDRALAAWIDRILGRLPPPWKYTCLKRALVLHYLLRRAGRPVELRIGVRRDERDDLTAHAWLVRDNQPWLEAASDRVATYRVLTSFTADGERGA